MDNAKGHIVSEGSGSPLLGNGFRVDSKPEHFSDYVANNSKDGSKIFEVNTETCFLRLGQKQKLAITDGNGNNYLLDWEEDYIRIRIPVGSRCLISQDGTACQVTLQKGQQLDIKHKTKFFNNDIEISTEELSLMATKGISLKAALKENKKLVQADISHDSDIKQFKESGICIGTDFSNIGINAKKGQQEIS